MVGLAWAGDGYKYRVFNSSVPGKVEAIVSANGCSRAPILIPATADVHFPLPLTRVYCQDTPVCSR